MSPPLAGGDALLGALLVEDNPGDARLFELLLAEVPSLPVALSRVDTLGRALALVVERSFDVVLLDLSLPDAHGLDTLRRLLTAAPDVAVVVLTGLDDESVAVQAMSEGAQDYLVKGQVEGPLLARTLRYAVERKRAEATALRLARESAAREKVEAQARGLRFLAEASQILVSSLDVEVTLSAVVQLAAEHTGDDCLLELALSGRRRRFGASGRGDGGVAERWAAHEGEHDLPEALEGRGASFTVPIVARRQVEGRLCFVRLDAGRPHLPEERALGAELAGRIALAVENARLYSEAQEATRARDEVLAVVSHDLRNPLTVVMMTTAQMRRAAGGLDRERQLLQVSKIESATQRMAKLIENLLDVTRIEAGALTLAQEPHELGTLLGEAMDLLKPLAEQKSLRLEQQLEDTPAPVRADKERVLQVFSNLVGNAIKFTPHGGRIELGARVVDGEAHLWVQDSGPGIAPDHLPKIFDRFFQARRADRQGAGLGLAIVKGLVEAHGGRVWAESRLGEGCTFRFTLPAG